MNDNHRYLISIKNNKNRPTTRFINKTNNSRVSRTKVIIYFSNCFPINSQLTES